jgi:Domain of unknown function (DU1801)
MAKANNKTVETEASVESFLATIKDEAKRKDCTTIITLIAKETKFEPKMWGPSIVGFGSYHYVYDSGREGDAPLVGLASRASSITFYIGSDYAKIEELEAKLGKHKKSGGCLHISKLADVDQKTLLTIIKNSIAQRKKEHKC